MPSHASPTLHLYLDRPQVVFRARINMPGTITYPITAILFDTVTTGTFGSLQPDMTLTLGSALDGDDLGRIRVQNFATSTEIPVGRVSQGFEDGTVYIQHRGFITGYMDFRVWAKLPYLVPGEEEVEAVSFKDSDIPFLSYTTQPPPVSNCGPGTADYVDADTGLITVQFPAGGVNQSLVIADGATLTGFNWNVEDGTIIVGSASSAVITATFPVGKRWVGHTVTDSNGHVHTSRCPVLALDPYADVTLPAWDVEGGQRFTTEGQTVAFRLFGDAPRPSSALPLGQPQYMDGCLVMFWDGAPTGPGDRSHMRLIGWLQNESFSLRATKTGMVRDTILHCLDVAGRLATLPGFPQALERVAVATSWAHMPGLTMRKCLHYLGTWHSTAFDLADILLPDSLDDYPAMRLDSAGSSLFDQINTRAKSMVPDHYVTCNALGQLAVVSDWMLQVAEERPEISHTLTEGDWSEIAGVEYIRPPRFYVRASAVLSSEDWLMVEGVKTLPLAFSLSPGAALGQGLSERVQGEQLAISQEALNICTGLRYARLNARYGYLRILTPYADFWAMQPALMPRIELEISAENAAQRGLDAAVLIGLVREMQARYVRTKHGIWVEISIVFERELIGVPAETVNLIPFVDAGSDQAEEVLGATTVTLSGSASDDGLPDPPGALTYLWTKISGPGTVDFANATSLATTADISAVGVYVLRLTADDGELSAWDEMTITLSDEPLPWAPPLPGDPVYFNGPVKAYILWDGAHVVRTWDLLDTPPVWELVDTGITGTIKDGQYVHIDEDTVGMWLLTTTGVWICMDILATTPAWSLVLTLATVQASDATPVTGAVAMLGMWNYASEPGYLIVATGPPGGVTNATYEHCYFWHTHNYGAAWTSVDIGPDFLFSSLGQTRSYFSCGVYGLDIHRSSGLIFAARHTPRTGSSNGRTAVFVSEDLGHTWVRRFEILQSSDDMSLLAPFPALTDPAYLVRGNSSTVNYPDLYVSTDEMVTAPMRSTPAGYLGLAGNFRVNTYTFVPTTALAWFHLTAGNVDDLMISTDSGVNWTLLFTSGISTGRQNTPNGWPPDTDVWMVVRTHSATFGGDGVIRYTDDNFAIMQNKEGNLAALLGAWVDGNGSGFALPKVAPNI